MQTRVSTLVAIAISAVCLDQLRAEDSQATAIAADSTELYRCAKARGKVTVSFKPGLSLEELVSWAMGFSCKNFAYSSQIGDRRSQVNIIAPSEMAAREAWQLFLTALRSMNLTVIEKGAVLEIVEAPQAKGHALPIAERPAAAGDGEQVTRALVRAEHISVDELAAALKAVASSSGEIAPLGGSSILLVTDFASHLARMDEIVAAIDRPGGDEQVWVVPVRHADVDALVATLQAIVGTPSAPAAPRPKKAPAAAPATTEARLLADERTRSILIVASPAAYRRVRALIRRLDVDVGGEGDGQIHMIRLEHADATELAATLTALLSGRPPAADPKSAAPPAAPPSRAAPTVSGEVRVTHDAATNSLLILATMRDFVALREIIRRLDSSRRQVYIEAMILEVSAGGERQLGAAIHGGTQRGDAIWLTGLQHDDLRSTTPGSLLATGLLAAVIGPPLTGLGLGLGETIPSFGVLFQALATDRRVHLVQSPRIMTTDNVEAKFKVAETRRELGGSIRGPGGELSQPIESVEASLILEVTPHIGAGGEVRLDIELQLEDFLPPRSGSAGSDKSVRQVINSVVVNDQESVIIGGLMVDRHVEGSSRVPFLGDLPIVGHLFKRSLREKEKRNLVILLTPYVLGGPGDRDAVVRRELARRAEFMRAHLALEAAEYRPEIDYRRKRGLLEAINQKVFEVEQERELLREAGLERPVVEEGLVEWE
jgi:general secretion pathway protein D